MAHYLTNIVLNDEDRCKYASEKSGLDVVFLPHPMPKDYSDPDDDHYHPDTLFGVYGSVYTNEHSDMDHSEFWKYWDEYPNVPINFNNMEGIIE